MNRKWRLIRLSIVAFLGSLVFAIALAPPGQAHWADLAVADVAVGETTTQVTLTFPTGLIPSVDDNRDGQLSPTEVRAHAATLREFLGDRIRLTNNQGTQGTLTLEPSATTSLPPNLKATAGTHSTVRLVYTWTQPVQGLRMDYDLFLPGVSTAHCLVTVAYQGQTQSAILRPGSEPLALMQITPWYLAGSLSWAIAACFLWGAMHALSPGHGKTIVGAYLIGSHATPQHALFLGLTTTITHTAGVFALGLATLLISNFILPERLYPWLSFLSGLIVIDIGLRLLINRLRHLPWFKKSPANPTNHPHHHSHHHHSHHDHTHHHTHAHTHHSHPHPHAHSYHSHTPPPPTNNQQPTTNNSSPHTPHPTPYSHSHLPPGADGSPVTWRSLLALGISGGMVPCPSALVVLLSMVAIGQAALGLGLVLAFSLGLAGTLTGLGLLLVGTRGLFERLPTPRRVTRVLPAMSALIITLLGLGLSTQAVMQIASVKP